MQNMNPIQMINEFNRFKASFNGDPRQEVQRLVATGRISQQQLNQLQIMANQFQTMLNGMKTS